MSTLNAPHIASSTYFPRHETTSRLHTALFAAAGALTLIVWLSAFGAGTEPRGYMAQMIAQAPSRVELPRVEVIGKRTELASIDASQVACVVDRNHKPG